MSNQFKPWQPDTVQIDKFEQNPYNGEDIISTKEWCPSEYEYEMKLSCIEADFAIDKLVNPLNFKEG